MMNLDEDTIAAIATPIGEGGIGVIRISGTDSLNVAGEMFRTTTNVPVTGLPTHTAHYGFAIDPVTSEHIDDGVLTIFLRPRSYTGEDSVEISCHGGIVPMRRVLESALRAGARLAHPGEFTKRAFLSGRLDLAQAEAVLDIIRAQTDEALRVARRQFEGALSSRVRILREELIGIMARVEASIDFPEDVDREEPAKVATIISDTIGHINDLLETADRGRVYREGIQAVITGRPNVGKSSLLNALLRESRAIVTPIPGTTRDLIEERINIRGIPVKTIDTAGIRESEDEIERIGVARARQVVENADLVLAVIDAEKGFTDEDKEYIIGIAGKKLIVVLNKVDMLRETDAEDLAKQVQAWADGNKRDIASVIKTAAPSNEGIADLEDAIAQTILSGGLSLLDGAIVSNVRHRRALEEARSSSEQALRTARSGMPLDFISIDLKSAAEALGSITGEAVAEDVIERIFSEFCIGK